MLDFYLLADNHPKDPGPTPSEFIGGLDLATFTRLQNKQIIDPSIDYYDDLRWNTQAIGQLRETILAHPARWDADVQVLLALLQAAWRSQKGIIAYAD